MEEMVSYRCSPAGAFVSSTRRWRSLRYSTRSAFCLVFAFIPVLAQDDANSRCDLYTRYTHCIAAMQKTPQYAYGPCKQYLNQFPSDDARRIAYVKKWTTNYEKALPYIQFLQGLAPDQNAAWYVYEPDMNIDLPRTSEKEGPYKVEISRSFGDAKEEAMLRKAEAVYSSPSKMVEDVFRHLGYWAQENPKEMAPMWGIRGNDDIQATNVVTARAVRYYYDLTLAARHDPHLPTGLTAEYTNLRYDAVIKHFDQYAHNKDSFENVYVADLTLKWSFNCGMLCGMGFTRNKLVVLDDQGNVIAMYLDAEMNSQSWVS